MQAADTITPSSGDPGLGSFLRRVLGFLCIALVVLALWRLADVVILVFGAVLLAVGIDGLAGLITRSAGLPRTAAVGVVVALGIAAFGLMLWFFGSVIAAQFDEIAEKAPVSLKQLVEQFQVHPYGRFLLEQAQGFDLSGATGRVAGLVASVAGSIARALGLGVLTFFVAVYLAMQPERYRRLLLRLVPPSSRATVAELLIVSGDLLRRWLVGQCVVMLTIGMLSGLGRWALGIDAALALGLVGGMLTFIPYVGAVLAAVPATLMALTQGPGYAVSVVLMYVGIHFVEGNFITPLVQAEATSLPPVLSLLSTVVFAILFGPAAVFLAAPLTLFLMAALEVLYVEQVLHELREWPPASGRDDDAAGDRVLARLTGPLVNRFAPTRRGCPAHR